MLSLWDILKLWHGLHSVHPKSDKCDTACDTIIDFRVLSCRSALIRWLCAPKHTTSPSTSWQRVSNSYVCTRSTNRTCQINLRYNCTDFFFSPPYFIFRSFPYISILGLNSTKQTPWRLQRTCQKNIQLLITHLPPSSPSSSLTWESLPHLQSAMNSSNFIYNCFTILQ